jgi:hypothetical protein
MSNHIEVPVGVRIQTIVIAPEEVMINVLSPGQVSIAEALRGPGVSAMLTHDAGVNWPDRTGCDLATAALKCGGFVIFQFRSMADACKCRARLRNAIRAGAQ